MQIKTFTITSPKKFSFFKIYQASLPGHDPTLNSLWFKIIFSFFFKSLFTKNYYLNHFCLPLVTYNLKGIFKKKILRIFIYIYYNQNTEYLKGKQTQKQISKYIFNIFYN